MNTKGMLHEPLDWLKGTLEMSLETYDQVARYEGRLLTIDVERRGRRVRYIGVKATFFDYGVVLIDVREAHLIDIGPVPDELSYPPRWVRLAIWFLFARAGFEWFLGLGFFDVESEQVIPYTDERSGLGRVKMFHVKLPGWGRWLT